MNKNMTAWAGRHLTLENNSPPPPPRPSLGLHSHSEEAWFCRISSPEPFGPQSPLFLHSPLSMRLLELPSPLSACRSCPRGSAGTASRRASSGMVGKGHG